MKKSELKEIIKANFLSEAEDSKKGNSEEQKRMEGAIRDDRDHIKSLEKDIKDNEDKLSKLKGDYKEDVSEAEEVDVEDNEDINVDVEDDIDIDDVSSKSEIEVDSELAGEDSDVAAILGLLTKAQEEAKALGDEKLMDQIGNTITYYTRQHVVAEDSESGEYGDPIDAEVDVTTGGTDHTEEEAALNLQESVEVTRFKKLAGLIK
jgi:hypothetical protein|tara:strand:- start:169 stop:786 length:618 start_codon:yes stop_codon:yes gene_type:complete